MAIIGVERRLPFRIAATEDTRAAVEAAKRNMRGFGKEADTVAGKMRAQFATAKKNWVGMSVAIAATAIAVRRAWDKADMAAVFLEQRAALTGLAKEYGFTADQIITATKDAARGLLTMSEAADVAARSMALGFAPDKMLQLVHVAEVFSDVIGGTAAEGANRLAKAIATGETEALKTMGVTVRLEEAMLAYAEANNVTAKSLTTAQRRQALFTAAMKDTQRVLDKLGPTVDTIKDKMDRSLILMRDFTLKLGMFLIRLGNFILGAINSVAQAAFMIAQPVIDLLALIEKGLDKLGISSDRTWRVLAFRVGKTIEGLEAQAGEFFDLAFTSWEQGAAASAQSVIDTMADANAAMQAAVIPEPAEDAVMTELAMEAWLLGEKLRLNSEYAQNIEVLHGGMTQAFLDEWLARRQIVANALGSMAGLMDVLARIEGKHQAAAFKAFKAFAIAQAIISAHASYVRALQTLPPPFSYIAAAAAFASGMARVASIVSTQPGGSSAAAPAPPPPPFEPQPVAQQPIAGPSYQIFVNGSIVSHDEFARDLIDSLNKAQADGVV